MIFATFRQLPAIVAPPPAYFWSPAGIAGGGFVTLVAWFFVALLRGVVCLVTGKVILRTAWKQRA